MKIELTPEEREIVRDSLERTLQSRLNNIDYKGPDWELEEAYREEHELKTVYTKLMAKFPEKKTRLKTGNSSNG